jgi:hypothetical protein
MEQTESSETSAYKIQTPGNYPEENIQNNITFLSLVQNMNQMVVYKKTAYDTPDDGLMIARNM